MHGVDGLFGEEDVSKYLALWLNVKYEFIYMIGSKTSSTIGKQENVNIRMQIGE